MPLCILLIIIWTPCVIMPLGTHDQQIAASSLHDGLYFSQQGIKWVFLV